jgi:hypothetical protein
VDARRAVLGRSKETASSAGDDVADARDARARTRRSGGAAVDTAVADLAVQRQDLETARTAADESSPEIVAARDHLATLTTHRELLLARRELVQAQAVNQGGGALDLAPFRDRAAEAEAKEAQAAAR